MKDTLHRNNAREYTSWDLKTKHHVVQLNSNKRKELKRLFKHMAKRRIKNETRKLMKEV